MSESNEHQKGLTLKEPPLPPAVPVEVGEVITDAEYAELMKKTGSTIRTMDVVTLEKLGIYTRGKGNMKIQGGITVFNQDFIGKAMNILTQSMDAAMISKNGKKRLPSMEKLTTLMKGVALISGKMTDAQLAAIEMERLRTGGGNAPMDPEGKPTVTSFKPGAPVVPGVAVNVEKGGHVHLHDAQTKK